MLSKNTCLLRINKDIQEIHKSPIEGIGIVSLDNNPKEYIVNIRIMSGIYEGYCLQLLLTIPDNYPIFPPKILIYPGQPFDGTYHHHIFEDMSKDEDGGHFKKFCFDLLENDFLSTTNQFSGWNPSYTISTLLLQVQNFLAMPDIPEELLPDKNKIEELMKSMDYYERIFYIKDGDILKVHTWKNPYPEMYYKNTEDDKKENKKEDLNNLDDFEDTKIKMIKDNLTCFISRLNYIDDPNILLGYPIKKNNNIKVIPIPEIISYDSYISQLSNKDEPYYYNPQNLFEEEEEDNLFNIVNIPRFNRIGYRLIHPIRNIENNFFEFNINNINFENDDINEINYNNNNNYNQLFKSANNEFYENWLPIYINENHFLKNKETILNSFSIIKYGNLGLKEYDFKPEHIFEILPNIIYEMIMKIFNNKSLISSSFIICFFQYILLFTKLFQIFRKAYRKYINNYLDKILNDFVKDYNMFWDLDKIVKILKLLILLLFANEDPNSKEMQKLEQYLKLFKNQFCLECFYNKSEFIMENSDKFVDDLFKFDIFYQIVDLISLNERFLYLHNWEFSKNSRKKIIKKMISNFKEIYEECNYDLRSKINRLIMDNLDFSNYFDLDGILLNFLDRNDKVDDELSKNYNLFLIFFIIKKKMKEKNFMKTLEDNYGVYLEVDSFIKEFNQILKKHKNIMDYNKYFGNYFNHHLNNIIILLTFEKTKKEINLNKKKDYIILDDTKKYEDINKIILEKKGENNISFNNKNEIENNNKDKTHEIIISKDEENEIILDNTKMNFEENNNKEDTNKIILGKTEENDILQNNKKKNDIENNNKEETNEIILGENKENDKSLDYSQKFDNNFTFFGINGDNTPNPLINFNFDNFGYFYRNNILNNFNYCGLYRNNILGNFNYCNFNCSKFLFDFEDNKTEKIEDLDSAESSFGNNKSLNFNISLNTNYKIQKRFFLSKCKINNNFKPCHHSLCKHNKEYSIDEKDEEKNKKNYTKVIKNKNIKRIRRNKNKNNKIYRNGFRKNYR